MFIAIHLLHYFWIRRGCFYDHYDYTISTCNYIVMHHLFSSSQCTWCLRYSCRFFVPRSPYMVQNTAKEKASPSSIKSIIILQIIVEIHNSLCSTKLVLTCSFFLKALQCPIKSLLFIRYLPFYYYITPCDKLNGATLLVFT